MNLKLDLGLGFRFRLRLDLPYVPVWPGCPSLNVCPMSRPGLQNVPESYFSEIFEINSSRMMHCYQIIPS